MLFRSVKSIPQVAKAIAKEGARQIETGTGILGKGTIDPRMNIIKDQGGMLIGGEKTLDEQLLLMKKNEGMDAPRFESRSYFINEKDPNAVALNQWIDTKVRKYIRNQLGSENDPILKAIESGVPHNFNPVLTGDTKYYIRNKRALVGKPIEGVAKTPEGQEWEYRADSSFTPKKSAEIKEILNSPME